MKNEKWFSGISNSEKREERKQELRRFKTAFEELDKLLDTFYKKKETNRDYSDPNWAYKQIAINEYNAVLEEIRNLIKDD